MKKKCRHSRPSGAFTWSRPIGGRPLAGSAKFERPISVNGYKKMKLGPPAFFYAKARNEFLQWFCTV